jgi:hypothetical protein
MSECLSTGDIDKRLKCLWVEDEIDKCQEVRLRCEDIKTEKTCEAVGSVKGKDC